MRRRYDALAEPTIGWITESHYLASGAREGGEVITATTPSGKLIGRDPQLAALEVALDELGQGRSGAVYIAGEPGIGKTALVAEALRRGVERGHRTLTGRAAEFELSLPLAVFGDALGEEFESLAAETAADAVDGRRLIEAVRDLLGRLSAREPVVLALDDLHWADAASIDVVCGLLHRGIDTPVLVVFASRPAQTEPRLMTIIDDAERRGFCRRLEPAPLSEQQAEELMGTDVTPGIREALYRESGGNPFYLEQLAAATRRRTGSPAATADTVGFGVPAAVGGSIQQEIAALSAPAKRVLQAGAVLGESFDVDLAAETAELKEREALEALDDLVRRDLIRPTDTAQRFRFRHPIVRRAVYESASPGWRLTAHRRAASALHERRAPAIARAHHVEQSATVGDEAAIELLVEAGRETARRAPASAASWFAAALRLIPQSDDNRDRRLGLLVERAAALGFAGNVEENSDTLHEFVRVAPRDSNPVRLKAAMLAALLDDLLGRQDRACDLLHGELDALHDQQSAEAADLKRILALTHYLDADWTAMADWAKGSLAADCRAMVRVGALSALAIAQLGLEDVSAAARSISEGAELFERLTADEVAQQPGVAGWLGWAEVCGERFADAVGHLERATTIAGASRRRPLTIGLYGVEGLALALLGRIDELGEIVESAFEAALSATSKLFLCWSMTQKCALELQRGDLYAAVRFGEQGVGLHSATGSPLTQSAHLELAEALLAASEPERSRTELTDDADEPSLPPFRPYQPRGFELLASAELALGHIDRAGAFADRASDVANRLGLCIPSTHAHRAQASVCLESGRFEEALDFATAAVEAADGVGARVEAARSRILAGRALAAAGERDKAVSELQKAYAALSDCGSVHYSQAAARELRQLGHVPRHAGREAAESAVGALTRRELEVIELLASGKTNRQIAGELFLSVRTVDTHVARIFEKLGINSRAAAASEFERARAPHALPTERARYSGT